MQYQNLTNALTKNPSSTQRPLVSLVGAGPGDPELLTLKALMRIQAAQVLLYDFLVSFDILNLAQESCEKICVGKRSNRHTLPQEEISQLIVEKAKQGLRVVRLKGGDPFLFGRGGEELQELAKEGIECEVIPGISAAFGAAARFGIPLTHRDHAQMVSFVTGHRKQGEQELHWLKKVSADQTLLIYMGLNEAPKIIHGLLSKGYASQTPIAVVFNATQVNEKIELYELGNILSNLNINKERGAALLIVGEVVSLHEQFKHVLCK